MLAALATTLLLSTQRGRPEVVLFPAVAEGEASLVFFGDTMLGGAAQAELEEHGYDYPFEGLTDLLESAGAAAVVGNHEAPITERTDKARPNKKWNYACAPSAAGALARAGITHLSLANNHAMDRGVEGLLETIDHLEGVGIVPFGAGANRDQAREPAVIEAGDTTVAVIGVMHPWSKYYDRWQPDEGRAGVAFLDGGTAKETARRAREKADVVVAFPHWGGTYGPVSSSQRRLFERRLAGQVDAVMGHHSHEAQAVDLIEGMPVLWSLGNGVFGTRGRFGRGQGRGLVARLVVGGGRVLRVEAVPIRIDNRQVKYQPYPCTADDAEGVLQALAEETAELFSVEDGVGVLQVQNIY